MAAAAAAASSPSLTGRASTASTIGGGNLSREALLTQLKSALLRSPRQWNGRPTTVLAIVGLKGGGKSTYINTILSVINGAPYTLQNAFGAAEADGGTGEDSLIPLHELLFQGLTEYPAYFFIYDTVGFPLKEPGQSSFTAKNYSEQDVGGIFARLLSGVVPSFGHSIQNPVNIVDLDKRFDDRRLPVQGAIAVVSGQLLQTYKGQEDRLLSFPKAAAAQCSKYHHGVDTHQLTSAAQGIPLFVQVTAAEKLLQGRAAEGIAPVVDEATGADNWPSMLHNPALVPVLANISEKTKVPYSRVRFTFGLNTLRAGPGTDIRELAALVPLVDIVREVVARDLLLHEQQLLIQNRDDPTQQVRPLGVSAAQQQQQSLPFQTCAQLKQWFTSNEKLRSLAAIVESQRVSGFELVRMTDQEIFEVFDKSKNFGPCKYLSVIVAPFRAAAELADNGATSAGASAAAAASATTLFTETPFFSAVAPASPVASVHRPVAAAAAAVAPSYPLSVGAASTGAGPRVVAYWSSSVQHSVGEFVTWNQPTAANVWSHDPAFVFMDNQRTIKFVTAGDYLISVTASCCGTHTDRWFQLQVNNQTDTQRAWRVAGGGAAGVPQPSSFTCPLKNIVAGFGLSVYIHGAVTGVQALLSDKGGPSATLSLIYLGA